MCGIVGVTGNLQNTDKDIFRDLLLMCQLRGEDSTGFFSVPNINKEPTIGKAVGPPHELFATKAWDTLNGYSTRAMIGHCRKATVGGVSRHTAHPFKYDNITGVHNGTLRNWRDLPTEIQQTDSATMFQYMSEVGAEAAIPKIDGAFAAIWWDAEVGLLNVTRNGERTLYYAFSENGEKMFFASEAWMITITCDRHGQKLMDLTPKGDHVTRTLPVETDKLFRVRPGPSSKEALVILPDMDLKGGTDLPKKEMPPFRTPYQWEGGRYGGQQQSSEAQQQQNLPTPVVTPTADASASTSSKSSTGDSKESSLSGTVATLPSKPLLTLPASSKSNGSDASKLGDLNDNIVDLFAEDKKLPLESSVLAGHGGLLITKEEYEALVDPNCVWCQTPHTFEELQTGGYLGDFIDDDQYICSGCMASQYGGYLRQ